MAICLVDRQNHNAYNMVDSAKRKRCCSYSRARSRLNELEFVSG